MSPIPTNRRTAFAVLFIAAGLLAYFQVGFMLHGLKYDMVDQYLPWRLFVTDCLRHGILPLWNPYQHWGYLFCADPQSGAWYPLNWLYALAGGYTAYANQADFMLHILLAGTGMYLLTRRIGGGPHTALLIGCSYMLSGFFTGNAQHLTYVIAGAWVPFVFCYYIDLTGPGGRGALVRFALAFFMLLSGGYPAFTIITGYVLLGWFIVLNVRAAREDRKRVTSLLRRHAGAGLLTSLLGAFVISSVVESLSYVSRSQSLPLSDALFNPFSPQSMASLLFPLVSARDPEFFNTDISMSNLYFGLFGLVALVLGLFHNRQRKAWVILGIGLFFLAASFGGYTPLREWLYRFLPFMDLFRFPSIFRLFALISFLLFASLCMENLQRSGSAGRRSWRTAIAVMSALFVAVYVYASMRLDNFFPRMDTASWIAWLNTLEPLQCLQLQSLLSGSLLILYLIVTRLRRKGTLSWLFPFVLADLVLAVQLNAPITVYDRFSTTRLEATLRALPHYFPVPENLPSERYSDSIPLHPPFWRNLSLLRREPGFDGFNSFRMRGYARVADDPELMRGLVASPVAYLSSTCSYYRDSIASPAILAGDPTHLFFRSQDRPFLEKFKTTPDEGDSVSLVVFKPGLVIARTTTRGNRFLTIKQHDAPGWKVMIDGQATPSFQSNYLFTSVMLKPGHHEIVYFFEHTALKISWFICLLTLAACLLSLLPYRGRQKFPPAG